MMRRILYLRLQRQIPLLLLLQLHIVALHLLQQVVVVVLEHGMLLAHIGELGVELTVLVELVLELTLQPDLVDVLLDTNLVLLGHLVMSYIKNFKVICKVFKCLGYLYCRRIMFHKC